MGHAEDEQHRHQPLLRHWQTPLHNSSELYNPKLGKMVRANTSLRAWGSKEKLYVKGMFRTELVTPKGARRKTVRGGRLHARGIPRGCRRLRPWHHHLPQAGQGSNCEGAVGTCQSPATSGRTLPHPSQGSMPGLGASPARSYAV